MEKGAQEAGKCNTALSSQWNLDDFPGLVNDIYFSGKPLFAGDRCLQDAKSGRRHFSLAGEGRRG